MTPNERHISTDQLIRDCCQSESDPATCFLGNLENVSKRLSYQQTNARHFKQWPTIFLVCSEWAALTAVMARLESARGQGRLPWRPGARHSRRYFGHRTRPRCCHRPGAVAGGPCHSRLLLRLQPATPAPTSSPIVVRECHQDACPGIHLVSPGLLQLTAVRHQRRTTSTPAVGAERWRLPGHRRPSVWPHHTSVTAAALAASPSARCVQDCGARTSVGWWIGSRVPRRWLSPSVGHWSSPIAVQFQWHSEAACSTNT